MRRRLTGGCSEAPACPLMTDLHHCAEASPHPHSWGSALSCPAVSNRSSSPDFLCSRKKKGKTGNQHVEMKWNKQLR